MRDLNRCEIDGDITAFCIYYCKQMLASFDIIFTDFPTGTSSMATKPPPSMREVYFSCAHDLKTCDQCFKENAEPSNM